MDYKDKKCLLGIPCGSGYMPSIMVQSLLQLHKPIQCAFLTVDRQRIDKVRNYFVQQTLVGGFDYLLMIDDDNPIPPETLELMLEDDKDIVGVPILSRNPNKDGVNDLCAFYSTTHTIDGNEIKLYHNIVDFKDEEYLHKVDAIGTGCILIKREVLEKMSKTYKDGLFEFGDIKFKEKVNIDGKNYERRTMSEDCEFSERAVKEGFEIYLDDRICPLHITQTQVVQYNKDKK